MAISRREFFGSAAAVAFSAVASRVRAAPAKSLRAAPGTAQLAPSGYDPTPVWAYGDGVPGPALRVAQGDRLSRRFVNDLPQSSTVHWHGVRIVNEMDGVPGLTQEAVAEGASFDYDFTLPDAGTYWYHPHNRTWEQLARGLYGALIVAETEPPEVDRDEVLLIDDWRLDRDATLHESFGDMHDWSHAGRIGNWITVNGDGAFSLPAKRHERLRLRLVNAANARIFVVSLEGLEGWVVALDGQPLEAVRRIDGRLELGPAQRADLIVDVTAEEGGEAVLVSHEQDEAFVLAALPVSGRARPAPLGPPAALPPNPLTALGDLAGARRKELVMEGGAMGRMQGAELDGERLGIRDLIQADKAWAFNGVAGLPKRPFLTIDRGETVRIAMVNDTAWPHAMHLHGHHFREVGAGGSLGPWRDTIMMPRGAQTEIAFVADNPGRWLFHCHMVEHAAAGMMTWVHIKG